MSFVSRFNTTSQREENKQLLQNYFQSATSDLSNSSLDATNFYVNGVYFLLDRVDPVLHCDQIGACGPIVASTQTGLVDPSLNPAVKSEICATCEHLVDAAKQMLLDPDAIDDLRVKLGSLCNVLKFIKEEDQCNQLVDTYLEQALNFLRNLQPVDYCRAIQLCPAQKAIADGSAPAIDDLSLQSTGKAPAPVLADFNSFGIETDVNIDGKEVVKSSRHPSPNCMLCKTIMSELFKFLHNNRTEDNIKYALSQVCKLIYPYNDDKQDQCSELVSAYTRELIEMLTEETDPNLLCILLGQCTYQLPNRRLTGKYRHRQFEPMSPVAPTMGKFIAMLDSSKPEHSVEACLECRMFIQVLQEEVKKPQSREQIKQFLLTKLCNNLPDPELKNACTQMVNAYADIFFKAVAQELDPKKACIELGVCKRQQSNLGVLIGVSVDTADGQSFVPPIQMPSLRPISLHEAQTCDDCQAVVNQIDEHLSRHPIEGRDLGSLINQACPRSANQAICRSMLHKNGHQIVRDLSNLAKNSRQICSAYYKC